MTRAEKLEAISKKIESCRKRRGQMPDGSGWFELDEEKLLKTLMNLVDLLAEDAKYWRSSSTGWSDKNWKEIE